MKKSAKSKSNVHVQPRPGRGYAEGFPPAAPAPVRSADPKVQNSVKPGVRYVGNVGDNPTFRTKH